MEMTLRDRIIDKLEAEDYPSAKQLLSEYLRLEEKDEFWYLASSDVMIGLEDYDGIVPLLEEALASGIDTMELRDRLAEGWIQQEKPEKAISILEECLNDPELDEEQEISLKTSLGRAQLLADRFEDAIQSFEDVMLEQNSLEVSFMAGIAYHNIGKIERMDDNFKNLCVDVDYILAPIDYLSEVGDVENLERYMDMYDMDDEHRALYLSKAYMAREDHENAVIHLEKFARISQDPAAMVQAVKLHAELGHLDKARRLYIMAEKIPWQSHVEPLPLYLSVRLFMLSFLEYKPAQLTSHLDRIIDHSDNMSLAALYCAQFAYAHGLYNYALSLLEPASYPPEDRDQARYLAGQCYLGQGLYNSAYDVMNPIRSIDDRGFIKDMAIASYCSGHSRKALKLAKELMPDGVAALIAVSIYEERDNTAETDKIVKQMIELQKKGQLVEDMDRFMDYIKSTGVIE